MNETISVTALLWRWVGASGGAWHFVSIGGSAAEALGGTALMRKLEGIGRGFGSIRVAVTVGDTRWQTSVFPHKADDGSDEGLLPVKAAVRKAEGLAEGEPVTLTLEY